MSSLLVKKHSVWPTSSGPNMESKLYLGTVGVLSCAGATAVGCSAFAMTTSSSGGSTAMGKRATFAGSFEAAPFVVSE